MVKIISYLIYVLQLFNKFIWRLTLFLCSFIDPDTIERKKNKSISPEYKKFSVDDPPEVVNYESEDSLDSLFWKDIIKNDNIKPIRRRNDKCVPSNISCPFCSAPSEYIYSRKNQNKGYSCKCCKNYFTNHFEKLNVVAFRCPHCHRFLEKHKYRSSFILYKCKNNNCPFYINKLNSMSKKEKRLYEENPGKFKLRYIYRAFDISFSQLNQDYRDFISTPVNFSRIHNSIYIVGLCLTYHINYGLSSRQTSSILRDVHEVYISHQTVENYCKTASKIVHPVLEYYPYSLSSTFAADETYISILKKEHYVFFFFDAVKKIITSYRVFSKRDSLSAIKAMHSTLIKSISKQILIVSDGNPIYNVAYLYWNAFRDYKITLKQVVGLKNTDEVSKQYRSEKQIIERLNRTLKTFYRNKGCFTSLDSANNYMVLFSVYFNFLRPHESLKYKTPVSELEIDGLPNMVAKWIKLLEMGQHYLYAFN